MLCGGKQGEAKVRMNIGIHGSRAIGTMRRCVRNHQRIVRAKLWRSGPHVKPRVLTHPRYPLSKANVRADASTESEQRTPALFRSCSELSHKNIDDRLLKRRTDVRQVFGFESALQKGSHGGLQSAEAEIEIARADHAPGKGKSARGAALRQAVHLRAARIPESKELCGLVKCLAGSIVKRPAEQPISPVFLDIKEQGMPAADNQRHMRRDFAFSKERGQQMALEMIDSKKRLARADSKSLCCRGADKESGCESRASRGCKGVDLTNRNSRFAKGILDQMRENRQVVS